MGVINTSLWQEHNDNYTNDCFVVVDSKKIKEEKACPVINASRGTYTKSIHNRLTKVLKNPQDYEHKFEYKPSLIDPSIIKLLHSRRRRGRIGNRGQEIGWTYAKYLQDESEILNFITQKQYNQWKSGERVVFWLEEDDDNGYVPGMAVEDWFAVPNN